jgi:hypothetical protein
MTVIGLNHYALRLRGDILGAVCGGAVSIQKGVP